jgi:hypothetical protein
MKAYSKAAKLEVKRKRGRPRKEGIRTDSGQLSRAKEDPRKVATSARMKHWKVDKKTAQDPRGGDQIGIWYQQNQIDRRQYEAFEIFEKLHVAYQRMEQSPDSLAVVSGHGSHVTLTDEEQAERRARITTRYDAARMAIDALGRGFNTTTDAIMFRRIEMPHALPIMRKVGNALADVFGC